MILESVFLLRQISYQKIVSSILLTAVFFANLSLLLVPFNTASAAVVAIDATTSTTQLEHNHLGSQSVFTTDQVGYKFYVDSSGACVYSKTLNGGASWGTAVIVDSKTTCFGVAVWYDRWTPGDTGTDIHIMTADTTNDDLYYNRLDTTTDARLLLAAPTSTVINTGQGGTLAAGVNAGSITKGTDGAIYMSMADDADSYIVECSSDCDLATSWTETGTSPMPLTLDYSLLMPLPSGNILLIHRLILADDIQSKVWNDTAGTWSASWTTIDASAIENSTYDPAFTAGVNVATGDVFLAYVDDATSGTVGGSNDDIRVWKYSSSTWSAGADVLTNSARGITQVALSVDANSGDVYVANTSRTTAGTATTARVYWASSTSAMSAWGAEQGPVDTTADDKYGVDLNGYNYQRLYVSWYDITSDDILGDTIADFSPVTEVLANGLQNTEVRASTSNFYVGGNFAIKENSTSRDVTDITITENGTVDASTALNNIKLYYDLDTSAPYDCASESYDGSESQFGSTDTNGFSAANGTSTFTDSVSISTTQTMCVYTVLDVLKAASGGSTLEIEVSTPTTDIIVSGGVTVMPYLRQPITGETSIKLKTDFKVQRGVSTVTGDTLTLTAGIDYEAPISSSSAFIRITNTGLTGAGPNIGNGTSNADDVTAYITDPENIMSSVTFRRGTGAVNNTRISWEIVEYQGPAGGENEMIVRRHLPLAYVSGNLTVNSAAITGVVDSTDVVVFITSQFNSNTGATVYNRGLSTAAWNGGTNLVTLTRGASGSIATTTYALVEFTGSNWKIQRVQHAYTAAGAAEAQAMTAVNSLSRTFIHVQKRIPTSTHANFGHEVWLSGIGQVSFQLNANATTPATHVSVAWVIENTQTLGTPVVVTRSSGTFNTAGISPQTNNISIGKTLGDFSVASLFVNDSSSTTLNTWPEPILGARLTSTTTYELWRSDISANIDYRSEVVEWPTAARKLEQNYYRLYVDNNAILPTDPWPTGAANLGENAEMTATDTPTTLGDKVRLRMTVKITGSSIPAGIDSFKLQYALRANNSTCSAISTWLPLGDIGSTTAAWRGFNDTPVDGAALSTDPPTGGDLLISTASVAGTYEEQNDTATNPFVAFPNDQIEYDWVVQHNMAANKASYCFRMVESGEVELNAYNFYPVIRTAGYEPQITNWRWYDDETNSTPTTSLAVQNFAPIDIANQNIIKLRLVLREVSGATGNNTKFALQYSEKSDFSSDFFAVNSTSTCLANSIWCYADGAGIDNGIISSTTISNADSCVAGVGPGCGTYNEATTSTSTFNHDALTKAEFEFTIKHAGARANAVYYFRLYDLVNDEAVDLYSTSTYPSLVTEGAALSFVVDGLPSGTSTAGVTTNIVASSTGISFNPMTVGVDYIAAHRVTINTNATEGYRVLQFARQQLLNSYGDPIPSILPTNSSPAGWNSSCLASTTGCVGYHTTDPVLEGGSARFAPTDSYSGLQTTPEEIMYSSVPTVDTYDVVYRIKVSEEQPAGDYQTEIVYLAIPTF